MSDYLTFAIHVEGRDDDAIQEYGEAHASEIECEVEAIIAEVLGDDYSVEMMFVPGSHGNIGVVARKNTKAPDWASKITQLERRVTQYFERKFNRLHPKVKVAFKVAQKVMTLRSLMLAIVWVLEKVGILPTPWAEMIKQWLAALPKQHPHEGYTYVV